MAVIRGKGEGSVYQRQDGRWVASISDGYGPDGRPKRRQVYGRTRKEVSSKLKTLLSAQQEGTLSDTGGITFGAFLDRWLEHKAADVRAKTLLEYRRVADKRLRPALGRLRLERLRPLDLDRCLRGMLEAGLSVRETRYAYTVARMALEQAVRWQMLPRNVAAVVTPPRAERREMLVWSAGEASRFLDCARAHRLGALFHLAIVSGMRAGELLGLRWADVDLEGEELVVRSTLVTVAGKSSLGEPKTAASRRRIALSPDTVAVLRAHRSAQELDRERAEGAYRSLDLVFASELGTPTDHSNLARAHKRLTALAGVPAIRLHDMRHTAASLLIRRRVSPKVVADRLGHTDPAFTLRAYTHLWDDQRREAAFSLEDLFGVSPAVLPN